MSANTTSDIDINQRHEKAGVNLPVKVGAGLFALWGVLHLWVGFEGLRQYIASPAKGQWKMLIGGRNAPVDKFKFPEETKTINVHANLLLNFCIDVAGYGVIGLLVGRQLFKRPTWPAYFTGVFLVGIADVSFTFLQLTSGVIKLTIPTVSGPVIWLLAACITPFGLPALLKRRGRQRI